MATRLRTLRDPRRRPLVYLPAAAALGFLVVLGLGIVGALLTVFFAFAFPYWLGERRPRTLALAALAVAVVVGLSLAGFATWDAYRAGTPLQTSVGGVLTEGTVEPAFGSEDTAFTFRVVYTYPGPPAAPPVVNVTTAFLGPAAVQTLAMDPVQVDPTYEEGALYEATAVLGPGTHRFHYAVELPDGGWVETVDVSGAGYLPRGPVNLSPPTYLGLLAAGFLVFVLLALVLPAWIVVAIYRWVRRDGTEG